jgi:hypothetical protein
MLVLTLLASILCTTPDAASAEVRVPKELQLEQPWQTGWACGPNSLYFLLALNGNVKDFEGLCPASVGTGLFFVRG